MSDQGPTVFKDRYELHRKLARGGMSDVYLARDQVLDRPVAIKVLFPEYAKDPTFVERFRREAQAAARLNHPNIVAVYDWGEQLGTYFIVMEYIEGRSLSEIIRAEGALHPKRAAEIAADVASALAFAHRNGVVHRDIKPGNVMVETSGHVKVADFGIAQALTGPEQAQLTRAGSVMGTATYFSPEQAQGKQVDPRSDLYSLGCVLFEMLTTRAPFTGDSPVSIAYKHVQEAPPTPADVGVTVPVPLTAIIMKCLAKAPDDRYANADDLRADLQRFLDGQPVLASTGALVGAATGATAMMGATTALPPTTAGPVGPGTGAYAPVDEEPPRKGSNGILIGLLVLFLIGLAVGLFFLASNFSSRSGNTDVEVPTVIGKTIDDAEKDIQKAGLAVSRNPQNIDGKSVGEVTAQNPVGGSKAPVNSTVILTYNVGAGDVSVPNVVGQQQTDAIATIQRAELRENVQQQADDNVPKGQVISQNPAGDAKVAKGSVVTIVVSSGKGNKSVPNVANQTLDAASNQLGQQGFTNVGSVEEPSTTVAKGRVIRTDPAAGVSMDPTARVTIVVSSGPPVTTTLTPPTTKPPTTTSSPPTTAPPTTTGPTSTTSAP